MSFALNHQNNVQFLHVLSLVKNIDLIDSGGVVTSKPFLERLLIHGCFVSVVRCGKALIGFWQVQLLNYGDREV